MTGIHSSGDLRGRKKPTGMCMAFFDMRCAVRATLFLQPGKKAGMKPGCASPVRSRFPDDVLDICDADLCFFDPGRVEQVAHIDKLRFVGDLLHLRV